MHEAIPHDVGETNQTDLIAATTQPRLCRSTSSRQFHSSSPYTLVWNAAAWSAFTSPFSNGPRQVSSMLTQPNVGSTSATPAADNASTHPQPLRAKSPPT